MKCAQRTVILMNSNTKHNSNKSTEFKHGGTTSEALIRIYRALLKSFGHRGWWPGKTRLEVCVGAILTQNTAWTNVEKAILRLEEAGMLNLERLYLIQEKELAALIQPAGYYNVKARRLKAFVSAVVEASGFDIDRFLDDPDTQTLRESLLKIKGIGPETADSIILYAASRPVFVVDAYTNRIFSRHGFIKAGASYDEVQAFFTENLPRDTALFNDFHAQIVELGKRFCRTNPLCGKCLINLQAYRFKK